MTTKNTIKKAIAKMQTASMNSAQKVKYAHDTQNTAKASVPFQASPEAQASMSAWQAAADALAQNQTEITKTESYLATLRHKEPSLVFDYQVAAMGYGGVVQSIAKGDPSVISAMGLALKSPGTRRLTLDAPLGLQIRTTRVGVESLVWDKVPGARVYVMQISVDPATDATWISVQGGGTKRKLAGLVHGQKYLLRVKAVGANMESPWSAALGITAG